MDPLTSAALVERWGAWGLVLFLVLTAVVTVLRGDWVPGYIYRKKDQECDSLRATTAAAVDTAADAVRTMDMMVSVQGRRPPPRPAGRKRP